MIQSMTGFGKSDIIYQNKKIHIEIKSLNSKNLDLSLRIAPLYREKDMDVRNLIATQLERGKVDFTLWIEKDSISELPCINSDVINSYKEQINKIVEITNVKPPTDDCFWQIVTRFPDVFSSTNAEELTNEEWEVVLKAIETAIHSLIQFRKQEGEALYKKLSKNLDLIEDLMLKIEPYEKGRVEKIKLRLQEKLSEIKNVDYDKGRLEQELIYYIEKFDISEEKQRLSNHINYFRETMLLDSGQGKKLGSIAQEMGREINTTGSKSNQAEMQNLVVMMKDELEQIKEQVLNIM